MGLSYVLDIHIEVDPGVTVAASHALALEVKSAVRTALPSVTDLLLHFEPHQESLGRAS